MRKIFCSLVRRAGQILPAAWVDDCGSVEIKRIAGVVQLILDADVACPRQAYIREVEGIPTSLLGIEGIQVVFLRVGQHRVPAGTSGVGILGSSAAEFVPVLSILTDADVGQFGKNVFFASARRNEWVLKNEKVGSRFVHDHVVPEADFHETALAQRNDMESVGGFSAALGWPEEDFGKLILAEVLSASEGVSEHDADEALGRTFTRRGFCSRSASTSSTFCPDPGVRRRSSARTTTGGFAARRE